MKRILPLLGTIALTALALVPYGWVGKQWPVFGRLLDTVANGEFAHMVGHSLIFIALGLALLICIPALARRPVQYTGLLLLAALAQEGFQLLYKGRGIVADDLHDIVVDLTAATIVWLVFQRRFAGAAVEENPPGL